MNQKLLDSVTESCMYAEQGTLWYLKYIKSCKKICQDNKSAIILE